MNMDFEDIKSAEMEDVPVRKSVTCSKGCSCCELIINAMCTGYNEQKQTVCTNIILINK